MEQTLITGDILKSLISDDQKSEKKVNMRYGIDYYAGKNDILKTDFRKFYVKESEYIDKNRSNFHLVNNFHKKLVDQKQGYIGGKPVALSVPEGQEAYLERLNDVLGKDRHDIWLEWIKGCCNQGYENLHPYINSKGEFAYAVIPAIETLYIQDGSIEAETLAVVRYYVIKWTKSEGEVIKLIRAEVWDENNVTYWQEDEAGDYTLMVPGEFSDVPENPAPHWKVVDTKDETVEPQGWGRIPFVKLKNNSEETTDLEPIKLYVDAEDIVSSGFINDLKDVQTAIWVLRGYEDEDLSEFMLNLQHFKAIKLEMDAAASAEPKTMEIPKEARKVMLEWIEQKIYQIGQGVNESELSSGGGAITNVVIRAHYTGLDIKANKLIIKMTASLYEFLWFATEYINEADGTTWNAEDLIITFNKSMIFNEAEMVKMVNDSSTLLSKRTLLANHPLVEDVEEELEAVLKEEAEALKNMGFKDDPKPDEGNDE